MISEVSKRYARALFQYAKETNHLDAVASQLEQVSKALGSSHEIQNFISSPVITGEEKMSVFKKAFGSNLSEEIANLIGVLVEKNRIEMLGQVALAYSHIVDESNGVTRGSVRATGVLNDDSRRKIETTVADITQKKVILNYVEDKSIMGGLVAEVGGWTFDDSLQTHLTLMSEELNRRG